MPTPDDPPRRHSPPPWETTPLAVDQERAWHAAAALAAALDAKRQRRRAWPLIGSLLAARDYRRTVKTVYSRGFDGADIDSRPDAALLHTYDAGLNKRLTLDAGHDQSDRDFPAADQALLITTAGAEPLGDTHTALQDLADRFLAARRAGDHNTRWNNSGER